MQLKHKETGKVYSITMGKILEPEKAVETDATASFLSLKADDGEEVGAVIGYTKDGIYSDANLYEIINNEGEIS